MLLPRGAAGIPQEFRAFCRQQELPSGAWKQGSTVGSVDNVQRGRTRSGGEAFRLAVSMDRFCLPLDRPVPAANCQLLARNALKSQYF